MPPIDTESGDVPTVVTLIHFNDCYNIEPRNVEPVGGAARFCSAIKSFKESSPIVLFSGDIIAPSIMSTFTKGEHMIPVMNSCLIDCALYGNHEFDFGIDNLIDFVSRTNFPWLMSNVIDNQTNRSLGEGKIWQIIERKGKRFGLIGLIEEEWLATLATLSLDDITYFDFVTQGRKLAKRLKDEEQVDYVIALTHMRTPNDRILAENVDEIDLILGGHDHEYEINKVNGKYIVKSGTDFRQLSKIDLTFTPDGEVEVFVNEVNINSYDFDEDQHLNQELSKYSEIVEGKMETVLGHFTCDLDGRFGSIRTRETNLGNFICDIMLGATNSDLVILNSGTLRSDMIHPSGAFTLRDLVTILPMMDPWIVVSASGEHVWKSLENGVSQWPKREGRFPQVSGVKFSFDPTQPPGQRIDYKSIIIGDEYLDLKQKYRLATKAYMYQGKDGYDTLKDCEVIYSEGECPEIITTIQNHFESIRILKESCQHSHHRQSLVCVSMRTEKVKKHETCHDKDKEDTPSEKRHHSDVSKKNLNSIKRCSSFDYIEHEQCKLEPKVEGRIKVLMNEVLLELAVCKQFIVNNNDEDLPTEDDNLDDEHDDTDMQNMRRESSSQSCHISHNHN